MSSAQNTELATKEITEALERMKTHVDRILTKEEVETTTIAFKPQRGPETKKDNEECSPNML